VIVAALCEDPSTPISIDMLQERIRVSTGVKFEPELIRGNALQIPDWVQVDGDTYSSIKCPVA